MSEAQLEQPALTAGSNTNSAEVVNQDNVINLGKVLNGENQERGIGDLIDRMMRDAKQWEENELARSNAKLYGLLTECYTLHGAMVKSDITAKAMRKGLEAYTKSKGYNFSDSTPLMTKIVKCVFGPDRRRANAYSTALIVATKADVPAIRLASWITERGGVEEIRRSQSKPSKTVEQRADEGKPVLTAEVLASVKSDRLTANFDTSKTIEGVVLLATREDDGSFAIRRVLQTESLIKAALAACADITARERKAAEVAAQTKASEQAREAVRQELKVA
jgi:hypothetical protein